MESRHEVVPAALDGQRVDRIVALITGLSRAEVADLIDAGHVRLDDVVVAVGKTRAHTGQMVTLPAEISGRATAVPVADPDVTVPVVYADADVIIVDKPPGLVVHPGAGHTDHTLVNGLLARFPEIADVGDPARPGIVHRLDKDTSGLMVVARTPLAYERLVAALSDRAVSREYVVLAWGVPEATAGMIDAPIGRSARDPTRMTVLTTGREARTQYRVERTFVTPAECALLTCQLETGRTHQIRVHLAAIGHPVVGDARYHGRRPFLAVPRPMLHAAALAFDHPGTGKPMTFRAPIPDDMVAVLATLS